MSASWLSDRSGSSAEGRRDGVSGRRLWCAWGREDSSRWRAPESVCPRTLQEPGPTSGASRFGEVGLPSHAGGRGCVSLRFVWVFLRPRQSPGGLAAPTCRTDNTPFQIKVPRWGAGGGGRTARDLGPNTLVTGGACDE